MLLERPGASIAHGTEYVYIPALGYWRKNEVRQLLKYANHEHHRHFFTSQAIKRMAAFAKAEDRNFGVAFTVVGSPRRTFGQLLSDSYALEQLLELCEFDLLAEMTHRCVRSLSEVDPYIDEVSVHTAEKLFPLIKSRLDKFLLDTIDVDSELASYSNHVISDKITWEHVNKTKGQADALVQQAADYMNQVARDRTAIAPWCRHEHFVPDEYTGELSLVLRKRD